MRAMTRWKALLFATAFLAISGCGKDAPSEQPAPVGISDIKGDGSVSAKALSAAISPLFDDSSMAETRAVVIVHNGKVIAERYAPGYTADTRLVSWSMAKSITGILVGMMVADGRLVLDDPAQVGEWQSPGDPRGKITLRNLMQMSSGLEHNEGATETVPIYEADTPRMLFLEGRDNVARYAEGHPLEAKPGAKWEYSTPTTHILADIMTDSLTDSKDPDVRRAAMWDYAKGRLFDPLGMSSAFAEFDRSGTMLGGSLIHATPRDYAKFGEFLRNNGSVRAAQMIPTSWIRFMRTSSKGNPAYGAQLWLNKHQPGEGEQPLFPDKGPSDAFAAIGHLGQYIIVAPRQRLTIVRLGNTQDSELGPVRDQLARIVGLF